LILARQLFDEMPARDQTSNFQVFQIGVEHVLDKDYRYVVILSRGGGLVEKEGEQMNGL
jgi:hypothetical protein